MKNINSILCLGLLLLLTTNISFSQETPEFLIDTSIVFGYSYDVKGNQAIAFDGTNYLVVWEDEYNGAINIIGTFVDQSGRIINPHPNVINITNGSYNHLTPKIAFDGTNYLVVWNEAESGNMDIVGTRISTKGEVLDPEGINISIEPGDQNIQGITFGGEYYFVAWSDLTELRIYGSRITTMGKVIDSPGIIIADSLVTNWLYAHLTSDGTNYLVAWFDSRYVNNKHGYYGSRINQFGEILDTIDINTFGGLGIGLTAAALAFDGNNYLFVGHEEYSWYGLLAKRISQRGVVIDTISLTCGCSPSISFNDDHYLVSFNKPNYNSDPNIYARRIDTSGVLIDSIDIQITQFTQPCNFDARYPICTSDGINSLIVWNVLLALTNSVMLEGSRIDKKGMVLDPVGIIISTNPNCQITPSVASDGSNYFITWKDTRYNIFDIYGTRIDQQGINLNPDGVYIRKIDDVEENPKVTFGGSYYMATWIGYEPCRDICRARIDQSGILIDTSSVVISLSGLEQNPSIASDGDKYLITYDTGHIRGILLDQSGTVMNTFPISIISSHHYFPRIAFNGRDYLVVWQKYNHPEYDLYGALVDTIGSVLYPDEIQICIDEGHQVYPSVASNGTNYLVVWQENLDSPKNIWGVRLDSSGAVIDTIAFPISLAEGDQEKPVVAFNGNEYVVVWQDNRNGIDYDIYGARVSTNGNVIDSFVVSNAIGDQLSPEIAYSSHNQVMVVYSGWTGEYEGKLYDCMRIWGKYLEGISGIKDYSSEKITEYELEQCYPNPFNPSTTIQYSIKERTSVELVLYDILGREVEVLVNQEQDAGRYKVNFNARRLASGVYFYRIQAGYFVETKKMLLLK